MKKFNAAIIGCGAIHILHADAIMNNPYSNLAAVVDIDESRARESSIKYGCRYYTRYEELLSDKNIDVVHICTPHYLHADIAIAAMDQGKHVIVEKPMAISPADASKMIEKSRLTHMKLGICFQNRYNVTSIKIKEFIDSGKGGRILGARAFVTWHRDEKYYSSSAWRGTWALEGGGVLINQAIHTIDLLQWFMGDIEKLKASIDTRLLKNIEVEDTAEATMKFKSGATALLYATNCYCVDSPISLEIVCEKALVKLEGDLTITDEKGSIKRFSEIDKATGEKAYWGCSHKILINDFYSTLLNGDEFSINGPQGLHAIEILDAIYKSHKTGCYVEF